MIKITEAKKVAIQKGLYSGLSIGAIYFIFFCTYSLAFWYGGKLYMDGVCFTISIFGSQLFSYFLIFRIPKQEIF